MKPRIKLIQGMYECSRLTEGDWVGTGVTPEEAYRHWYFMNLSPDKFNLAL